MKNVLAFISKFLFRKDSFYYHAEELQFEEQAEQARVNYLMSYKKAS